MALLKLSVAIGVSIIFVIVYVLIIGYQRRLRIYHLRKQGVAMPTGWSWWFGHLRVLDEKLKGLPPDTNVYMAMRDLVNDHADTEAFIMDLWPMFEPTLMISGPEIATQASIKYDLPKARGLEKSFRPVVGAPSLITMNNEQWRMWRSLLNPAFSASHMLSLVPSIVDTVDVFCNLLENQVGRGVFSLDDMASRLTMDVITKTTLDMDIDNQRSQHSFPKALNTILKWHSFWDPRILLNPLRIPVQWYYDRIMKSFLHKELRKRFEELKSERAAAGGTIDRAKKAKSVIALALEEYITQTHETKNVAFENLELDETFVQIAANQIRLFIFAGNDSTATTIVYAYHALSKNSSVLAKVREEHDTVFGTGADAGEQLRKNPALINLCPYTMAVIKETLRLYPPSSALRAGLPGVSITDMKGNAIPTQYLYATIMHHYVQTNPRIWPRPLEFLPERWLVESGHELYPPPGAYRPFEQGPRSCIAQTLVYNEIRIALIMTARRFYIKPAYDEWDAAAAASESLFTELVRKLGLRSKTYKTVFGERAYQSDRSGAHPADGYPCRVEFAASEEKRA